MTITQTTNKVKTIHMVRAAQAEHEAKPLIPTVNLVTRMMWLPTDKTDHKMPDPVLTDLGRRQCRQVRNMTRDEQKTAQLIVTSPLKSALETTVILLEPAIKRLGADKAIVLGFLQETGPCPHATPTKPLRLLQISQGGAWKHLNFNHVSARYASKSGALFGTDQKSRQTRCLAVLNWLMDREEDELVLVSHERFMNDLLSYRPDQAEAKAAEKAARDEMWDAVLFDGDRPDLRRMSERPPWIWQECEFSTFKLHHIDPCYKAKAPILVPEMAFDPDLVWQSTSASTSAAACPAASGAPVPSDKITKIDCSDVDVE